MVGSQVRSPGARRSPAQLVSYLLEPKNWLIATVIGVGGHADGLAGTGWGLLAAFFTAILPTLFISHGVRHGRWDDRNVGARRPRLIVLAFIMASVAAGLILLVVLGAPALLTGYLAFMLVSVAVLAVITTVWKISIHCAVASGSVAVLALTYGPLVLPAYLLVALLGWSRVTLKDHTIAQVVAGSVLGALAAVLAYATLVA
jgi:membrane-associated phospholipid phosphatase